MHINKQTTAKAGFNPTSIKNFNVKKTFKNFFHNLIHIDFTIFCVQMSIQIGNVSKEGKISKNKPMTNIVGLTKISHGGPEGPQALHRS